MYKYKGKLDNNYPRLFICLLLFYFFYFHEKFLNNRAKLDTVGKKSIRALEIVLAIFLCFECQFLSFYACYKEYKA